MWETNDKLCVCPADTLSHCERVCIADSPSLQLKTFRLLLWQQETSKTYTHTLKLKTTRAAQFKRFTLSNHHRHSHHHSWSLIFLNFKSKAFLGPQTSTNNAGLHCTEFCYTFSKLSVSKKKNCLHFLASPHSLILLSKWSPTVVSCCCWWSLGCNQQ